MHLRQVSLSAAPMGNGGDSSHVFSHTQWTMLKGTVQVYCLSSHCGLILSKRVLIACIKSNGRHLCTTCKMTNDQVHSLGTKSHDQISASRRRVDSEREQLRVDSACKKIYQYGYVADGVAIDKILRELKTPIRVCSFLQLSTEQHLNLTRSCVYS